MAFHYRLETMLRLQCGLERQAENRLQACGARLAKLQNELLAWNDARLERKRQATEQARAGIPGVMLQFGAEWDNAVRRKQHEIRAQIALAIQARELALREYSLERQKREILQSLKVQLETVYDQEQLRRMQQTLDEMHLSRNFYYRD